MTPLLHFTHVILAKPRALLLLCLTLVLLISAAGYPGHTQATASGPVLIVGDSLSSEYGIRRNSGWVHLLRQRLDQQLPSPPAVINASISGDTTSGGLTRLPALLARNKPSLVIIELGGNDALRGLSLDMTRENLTQMSTLAKQAGAQVVIVGMQIPPNYGPAYSESFRDLFGAVAQSTGAALVPFLLAGLETDRTYFISDGIHPAENAQPRLLDNVWPIIAPLLGVTVTSRYQP
jgi:acyl-CoA thioesterase-1